MERLRIDGCECQNRRKPGVVRLGWGSPRPFDTLLINGDPSVAPHGTITDWVGGLCCCGGRVMLWEPPGSGMAPWEAGFDDFRPPTGGFGARICLQRCRFHWESATSWPILKGFRLIPFGDSESQPPNDPRSHERSENRWMPLPDSTETGGSLLGGARRGSFR
jgi:hypothetical protein